MRLIQDEHSNHRYWLLRHLGGGVHGTVYECVRVLDGAHLAAKRVTGDTLSLGPRKSWAKEFVGSSNYSPGQPAYIHTVVALVDAFVDYQGHHWLIQERCDGTVTDLFADQEEYYGQLWLGPIARDVLRSLDQIHLTGSAHNDIHAANVFFRVGPSLETCTFKVGDFSFSEPWWKLGIDEGAQDHTLLEGDVKATARLLCEVVVGRVLDPMPSTPDLAYLLAHLSTNWVDGLLSGVHGDFRGEYAASRLAKALGVW